MNEAV